MVGLVARWERMPTYEIDRAKKLIRPKDVARPIKVAAFKELVDVALRAALDGSRYQMSEYVEDERSGVSFVDVSTDVRPIRVSFGGNDRIALADSLSRNDYSGDFVQALRYDHRVGRFVFDASTCTKVALPKRGWRRDPVVVLVDALKHQGEGTSLVPSESR